MHDEPIPLLDLGAQYQGIRDEVLERVREVVDSQRFIFGPEVESLEKEIAAYCGAAHAVGVSSGTDALLVSMMALDIAPGDEIITTPYTFFATVGCIHRLGARPVFVDIDPATFNLDVSQVEDRITPRTRAIIPVHLFGQCADMDPLLEIGRRHRLRIVEDAAQSIGAEYRGKRAGGMGDFGCFSFYPAKNLGAFGDGGMVTLKSPELEERLRMLCNHGAKPKYYHSLVGGNFRLDAIQAAVLRIKLGHLDEWSEARRKNALDYQELFSETDLVGERVTLPPMPEDRHVFNQFVIRVQDRDRLLECFREKKIGCEIYYPVPLHRQKCFEYLGYREGDLPESEKAAREALAIPIYPELAPAQTQRVVETIQDFYKSR